jgi:hypothetical protein
MSEPPVAKIRKREAYKNLSHPGNSPKYYTGEKCIEEGCRELAGTMWSAFWCVRHNIERLERISGQLEFLRKEPRPCRKK